MTHGQPDRVAPKPTKALPDLELDPRVERVFQRVPAAAVLAHQGILTWSALRAMTGADLHSAGVRNAAKVAVIDLAGLKSHHNEPAKPEPQWAIDMMAAPKVTLSDCPICKGARTVGLDIRDDRGARTGAEVVCACTDPAALDRKLAAYPRAARYRVGDGDFVKITPDRPQVAA